MADAGGCAEEELQMRRIKGASSTRPGHAVVDIDKLRHRALHIEYSLLSNAVQRLPASARVGLRGEVIGIKGHDSFPLAVDKFD